MGKLVRDKIPDLIRADGGNPSIRILDEHEYRSALHAKLAGEAAELAEATGSDAAEELADVREVLLAVADLHGIRWTDVERIARTKHDECGGFPGRVHLG
ncbi:MAG TPA: nucleoside triphosphate pyrophosphohydrolase [Pseudonocardiaceae bacterium]|jgi:predicted house-cleaning noncanonical NTP pyrophosphatase (MazG superfamily)